ncbi:MAG: hypothetical protein MdMp014T_1819 [Treponematales bacterium]
MDVIVMPPPLVAFQFLAGFAVIIGQGHGLQDIRGLGINPRMTKRQCTVCDDTFMSFVIAIDFCLQVNDKKSIIVISVICAVEYKTTVTESTRKIAFQIKGVCPNTVCSTHIVISL